MMRMLLIAVAVVASVDADAHAQQPKPQPPQNIRCITDSFGNTRCTDGTTILRDSNGVETVIVPPRREERTR